MLTPVLSSQPSYASFGDNNSWIKVDHDYGSRPLYAQAVYDVNSPKGFGLNGVRWLGSPGTLNGPFGSVLLTTTANGETHARVASITAIDGTVIGGGSNPITVLAGTYIYNVKAITVSDSKTGVIAYL